MHHEHDPQSTQSVPGGTGPLSARREHFRQAGGLAAGHPTQIGPYKILETLGEGGMGIVYLAEQTAPIHRRVALKIIKAGMDTRQVVARFETEREALALMNHPNVAKVFDAGTTETGRPYFAMEYVEGAPITDYCDRLRLNMEDRLRLFIEVCHAIQHAHQKGIIHRDIKPSNVLVVDVDGRAVPKVIDFGIAKATQQRLSEITLATEDGQFMGTPAYMSPEQAGASPTDIDTRTDVYSLGVLLYELLVGSRPFDDQMLRSAALSEVQRIIREVDPPKPSTKLSALGNLSTIIAEQRGTHFRTLTRQLRGDLDWIVMKCLEKDRTRRYETVNALLMEIGRYLNHEPVLAGPPSAIYRIRKFVRRNKVGFAAGSTIAVLLILGVSGTTYGMFWALREKDRAVIAESDQLYERKKAERSRDEAAQARTEAEAVTQFLIDGLASADPEKKNKDVTVRQFLDQTAASITERFKEQPLVEARTRLAIAESYLGIGLYVQAEQHALAAVSIMHRLYGPGDRRTNWAQEQLVRVLMRRGQYGNSSAVLKANLEVQRQLLGDDNPRTLHTMTGLGVALSLEEKHSEALEVNKQALEISKRLNGDEHSDTLSIMGNMASEFLSLKRYPEAEELCRKTLQIQTRILGESHSETLNTMHNLANMLKITGQLVESEALYRKKAEISVAKNGAEHTDSLTSMSNLAIFLAETGRPQEAEQMHRQILETRRRVLGDQQPRTIASRQYLAQALALQGDFAEAEQLYRQVLDSRRQVFGDQHARTIDSVIGLIGVCSRQGRFEEAETFLQQGFQWFLEQKVRPAPLCARLRAEVDLLYSSWEQAAPDTGCQQKRSEWLAKVDELSAQRPILGAPESEVEYDKSNAEAAGATP